MAVSSKAGVCYGWISYTNYSRGTTDTDFAMLASLGYTRIRIAQGWYVDTPTLNMTKDMAQRALARPEFTEVLFGATPPNPFTGSNWTNYKNTHLPILAQWCQDQNDPRLVMMIGNEEEDHNTGTGAPDDATLQADYTGLLTSLQSIYSVGKIMYITTSSHITDWATIWLNENFSSNPNLLMGINVYNTPSGFRSNVASVISSFGDQGRITEWSDGGVGVYCYPASGSNEKVFEQHIRQRLGILDSSDLIGHYFFQFNADGVGFELSDGFANIRRANGDYRLAWNVLKGGRYSFIVK